jgi:hypothetical protein
MAWPPNASRVTQDRITPDDWNELGNLALCRQGVTEAATPGDSPWILENTDLTYWVVYIKGGSVSDVLKNGTSMGADLPMFVILGPGQTVTIAYDVAPTVVVDK